MTAPTIRILALANLALVAAACGGSQSNDATTAVVEEVVEAVPTAWLRVQHAAQTTAADVILDGGILVDDAPSGATTDYIEVPAGSWPWAVTTASGASTLAEGTADLAEGGRYILVVHGAGEAFGGALLEVPELEVAPGTAFVRFLNAAPATSNLEFIADGRSYAAGLNYGDVSNYVQFPAGGVTLEFGGASAPVSFADGSAFTAIVHPTGEGLGLLVVVD